MAVERLILEDCESRDNGLLRQACDSMGVDIICVDRYSLEGMPEKCPIDGTAVSGGWTFCRHVARSLRGHVLEPSHDFLPSLPFPFVNRQIKLTTLTAARLIPGPQFVKPVSDKHFRADVYDRGTDIPILDNIDQTLVITSDPVVWDVEYRLFVLDRHILGISPYRWTADERPDMAVESEALRFGELALGDSEVKLPRAVVLDIGIIAGTGWSVVEANAAAMSGIYDCDPLRILEVLEASLVAG